MLAASLLRAPCPWNHVVGSASVVGRVSPVQNVHRLEKLDWGFLLVVTVVAYVPGWTIEVLRAVAAHSDVLPLRARPCDLLPFFDPVIA